MKSSDRAIRIQCAGDTLAAILTLPVGEVPSSAVVVIVGGPQYRVGSHRQFILLARRLAAAGIAVLRFDFRGMGDSSGKARPFTDTADDICAAIDAVCAAAPTVSGVALWGLCDGASAALLYWNATADRRVTGMCLLNPWVRSEQSLAQTQIEHYYARRLVQMNFWKKLASGKVARSALADFVSSARRAFSSRPIQADARDARFQDRMAAAWHSFPGRILLLLSRDDLVASEFSRCIESDVSWRGALEKANVTRHSLQANHTCSSTRSRAQVEEFTLDWQHGYAEH